MDMEILKDTVQQVKEEIKERISGNYADRRGREMAEKYIMGLMSTAERKNGWQLDKRRLMPYSSFYTVEVGVPTICGMTSVIM